MSQLLARVRTGRSERWSVAAISVAAVLALTGAQIFYQTGAASYRTIWAEDGEVFYDDALRHGLGSLARPYSGYLQIVPRMLALPATWFPVGRIAIYLAVAAAACCSLVALSLYWLTDQAIASRRLRAVLVIVVALHPVLVFENLATITNVIWVLGFAVFWALLRRPLTRVDVLVGAVVVFLGTMSTTLTVLYLPVAAYVAWTRRDRYTRIVLGAYALALLLQSVAYLTSSDHGATGDSPGLPTLYVARVLSSAAVGEHWASQLWNDGGRARLFPFAALLVLLVIGLLLTTRGWTRSLGAVAAAYSIIIFVAPLLNRGTVGFQLTKTWTLAGGRYAALGVLFILSSILVMVPGSRIGPRWREALVYFAVIEVIAVVAFAYRFENPRSLGPEWYPELVATARHCPRAGRAEAAVPITPQGVWVLVLPCRDIRSIK